MTVKLVSAGTEFSVHPGVLYANTPVRRGTLDINDSVLAPFSWSSEEPVYSDGKVVAMNGWLMYSVQSSEYMQSNLFNTGQRQREVGIIGVHRVCMEFGPTRLCIIDSFLYYKGVHKERF